MALGRGQNPLAVGFQSFLSRKYLACRSRTSDAEQLDGHSDSRAHLTAVVENTAQIVEMPTRRTH